MPAGLDGLGSQVIKTTPTSESQVVFEWHWQAAAAAPAANGASTEFSARVSDGSRSSSRSSGPSSPEHRDRQPRTGTLSCAVMSRPAFRSLLQRKAERDSDSGARPRSRDSGKVVWWPVAAHRPVASTPGETERQCALPQRAPADARAPAAGMGRLGRPRPSTGDQSLRPRPQERSGGAAWAFVPPAVPALPMPLAPRNVFSGKVRASTLLSEEGWGGSSPSQLSAKLARSSARMLPVGHVHVASAAAKGYGEGGERGFRRDVPQTPQRAWHSTQRSPAAWRCKVSEVLGTTTDDDCDLLFFLVRTRIMI